MADVGLPLWNRLGTAGKVVRDVDSPRSRRAALGVRREAIVCVGRGQLANLATSTFDGDFVPSSLEVPQREWGHCDWLWRRLGFSGWNECFSEPE